MNPRELQTRIEAAYERRQELSSSNADPATRAAIIEAVAGLDRGEFRVAQKIDGRWQVHAWLKQAVLLYFRIHDNQLIEGGFTRFFDKVPLKYAHYDAARFTGEGVRVVPHAIVRHGAYVAPSAVLMPCFVNIGAYVGEGTMVDTWATVASCAQIGRNVHLSGGVGIGGVLEPLQATPTIIEDNCFVGARSEVVEGVVVGEGSVISMGVFISATTPIYDRTTGQTFRGAVPPGSVVMAGSMPSKDGSHSLNCAVIVKRVDAQTRAKTSPNELLRPSD
jgi:2,3,4,5-tetrahydropyridine-2-carboxylate N-succinyltransferase